MKRIFPYNVCTFLSNYRQWQSIKFYKRAWGYEMANRAPKVKSFHSSSNHFTFELNKVHTLYNLCYITHSQKFPENQGKHQNFDPSILAYKFGLIFVRMKQKINKNGRIFKMAFFKIANSQNFFVKISQIRHWVSRID